MESQTKRKEEYCNCWRCTIDNIVTSQSEWEKLSPEEKKKQLFLKQKHTLDLFLERNAISQVQYDKSLGDLRDKMGIK